MENINNLGLHGKEDGLEANKFCYDETINMYHYEIDDSKEEVEDALEVEFDYVYDILL